MKCREVRTGVQISKREVLSYIKKKINNNNNKSVVLGETNIKMIFKRQSILWFVGPCQPFEILLKITHFKNT